MEDVGDEHNDGPWVHGDDYRKINGVVRYSRGDAVNGLSVTSRDPGTGETVEPVTPLVRAKRAEVGIRPVSAPHLHRRCRGPRA